MDLRNLLSSDQTSAAASSKAEETKPELRKRGSSINDLMNNDDNTVNSSSPINQSIQSPVINKNAVLSPTQTPMTHKPDEIKARSSIVSFMNDTDVDIDGKETPSIARRLSYEISASESNSPVVPKKTITRAPSLQDIINADQPVEFEEPEYNEDGKSASSSATTTATTTTKKTVKKEKTKKSSESTDSKPTSERKGKTPNKSETPAEEFSSPQAPPQRKSQPPKNIDEEINRLENLEKNRSNGKKSDPNKPTRYTKPPIWATKWVPSFKAQKARAGRNRAVRTGKADTDVSFTDTKPYNDLTRKITNWVYAQIVTVPKEQRQFLELEVKFGRLWHKATDRRVLIPVTNECIIDDSYILDCFYRSGMEREHYDRVKKYITGLTRLHKEKFKTMRFDQVDTTYREGSNQQVPKFIRLTTDKSTGRVVANLEKKKLGSLFIHSPDLMFDYRLSMSLELPNHDNPERFANHIPENERQKKRTSFFHESTATRVDMTEVQSKSRGRHNDTSESLELELEVDMNQLLDAFEQLENDQFTFEELTETLLDNARLINRFLAKPVPK